MGRARGYRKDLFATWRIPHPVHSQVYGGPNTHTRTNYFAEQERFLPGKISTLGIRLFQFHCWFHHPLTCDLAQVTYYCLSEGPSSLIGYIKYPTCLTLWVGAKRSCCEFRCTGHWEELFKHTVLGPISQSCEALVKTVCAYVLKGVNYYTSEGIFFLIKDESPYSLISKHENPGCTNSGARSSNPF